MTDMQTKEFYSARELAGLPGMPGTERGVQKLVAKHGIPFRHRKGRGGGREYHIKTLPSETRMAILVKTSSDILSFNSDIDTLLPKKKSKTQVLNDREIRNASLKANILSLYQTALDSAPWGKRVTARNDFMAAYNSGIPWPHLYQKLGPLSWKTLESWSVKLRKNNNDGFYLADKRGRHLRGTCSLTSAQTNIFLKCALHPNKPKISESIRIAKMIMRRKGIEDHHSEATYRRWIKNWQEHNYHIWVWIREGAKAWNDECAKYIERDLNILDVGDVIVADGHSLNFEIVNPWTGKRQNHMTLILFYDMRSNMPLGWEIMPTENTAAISSALRRAVISLGKYPRVVYLDNGKAFKSRFFKGSTDFDEKGYAGLYKRMGCQTIFAWPYHGQSKTVERFFGSFAELERMNALSYTGTSIDNKPPRMMRGEKQHRRIHDRQFGNRCLSLTEAHQIIASWFDLYASREQQNGHLKGLRPIDIFLEGKGPGIDKAELTWLMMSTEIKRINRNGISFQGRNYYHPALYGRKHSVIVKYDLQDTSSIWVLDKEGTLLCEATPNDQVHPAAGQLGTGKDKKLLREHIENKRRQEKETANAARTLLANEILPEHDRQMQMIGLDEAPQIPEKKQKPEVVRLDHEKIAREVAEMQRLQKEVEERDFRDSLLKLNEADRYERLIELTTQGVEIGPEWQGFMSFFEQTEDYSKYEEYWESCRIKNGLMHRTVSQK